MGKMMVRKALARAMPAITAAVRRNACGLMEPCCGDAATKCDPMPLTKNPSSIIESVVELRSRLSRIATAAERNLNLIESSPQKDIRGEGKESPEDVATILADCHTLADEAEETLQILTKRLGA